MTPLFLVQTHKDPGQIVRLVRLLRAGCPGSIVLVSHDFRSCSIPHSLFGKDPNVYVIEGRGGRGDFEIVESYLAALRWLRDKRIYYDWLTNLSGQDYPVAPLAAFANDLSECRHDGFLHHFDAFAQNPREMAPMAWPPRHGMDRYLYQYTKLKGTLTTLERALFRLPRMAIERCTERYRFNTAYGLLAGYRADRTPFSDEFRCYAGSYWHTIRRRCAEYMLDFVDCHPEATAYLRKVLVPDECFIQTVLVNNRRFRFVRDNRRYYDMSRSRLGHPKTMTKDDLPRFAGRHYVFARKFESNDVALLDKLDQLALADTEHVSNGHAQAGAFS